MLGGGRFAKIGIVKNLTCLLILAVLVFAAQSALAHGFLARTEPTDGAVLPRSPETVKVWFSEPIQPASGKISVISSGGRAIEIRNLRHDAADNTLLIAELPPNLPDGAYIVTASAVVVSDGHEPSGSFVFWVGAKQSAPAEAQKRSPAYGMVILFLGVLAAAGGASLWISRHMNGLDLQPPVESSDHFPLE